MDIQVIKMQPLQRKMFANGDEVLERVSSTSQLNPQEFTFTLGYVDGKPVAIKKQTQGFGQIEDEIIPIQTNLSASGDPKEAFEVMRRNETIGTGLNTALGIGSLFAAPEIAGYVGATRFGKAVQPFLGKAGDFLARNLSPVRRGVPYSFTGPVKDIPGFYLNPRGLAGIGIPSVYAGGQAAMTTPEDVAQSEEANDFADEIAELERKSEFTGRTSYEAAIKSAIESDDRNQVIVLRDKMKELYKEDSPLADEYLQKPQQKSIDIKEIGEDELAKKRTLAETIEKFGSKTPIEEKEPPLLQNKNFLDLMRNIGIQMVETGDIGLGISLGSAEALKERRAEELLDDERQTELDKIATEYGLDLRNARDKAYAESIYKQGELEEFQIKENIKTRNDLVNNPETSAKMAEVVLSAETSDVAISYLKQARELISKGDVTGISPALEEAVNKAFRFLGKPVPLSPREKARGLLAFVAKADVKELLGESGRTISNIDREIAAELVGKIDLKTGKEDVLEQLSKSIAKYERVYKTNMGKYNSYNSLYQRFDLVPPHQLGKSLDETRGQPIAEIKMSDYT